MMNLNRWGTGVEVLDNYTSGVGTGVEVLDNYTSGVGTGTCFIMPYDLTTLTSSKKKVRDVPFHETIAKCACKIEVKIHVMHSL
jgi:hypothetical protein